jgi:hypothetical protein
MIYGIGTDICDIRRIRASLDKHGERFAQKILSEGELATWTPAQRTLARTRRALSRHAVFRQGGLQQGDRPGDAFAHELAAVRGGQAAGRVCNAGKPSSCCTGR